MKIHHAIMFTGLVSVSIAASTGIAEEGGAVESRGLNLPRVTVPPPPPTMQPLNVRVIGEGLGKVTLPPAAFCPPACSAQYPPGAPVVLAPLPAPGSTFAGWDGDCRGTAPCTLRMDQPRTVEAKFNKAQTAAPTGPSTPAFPDVAKTPSPGGPIPIPYPNTGGAALAPELAAISTMLANGQPANIVLDAWKGYVTRRVQSRQPLDLPSTLQQIRIQAETQVKVRTDADRAGLQDKLKTVGEENQQAQVTLQNLLQKQQHAYQAISNMMNALNDTAMTIIGNMK